MSSQTYAVVVFVFNLVLLDLFSLIIAQTGEYGYWCGRYGNYTSNSTFPENRDSALAAISSLASTSTVEDYGFHNLSVGESPDTVYAMSICRGDVALDVCRSCINDFIRRVQPECPNSKEAIWRNNVCALRYSSETIFHAVDTYITITWRSGENVTSVDKFNEALRNLFDGLKQEAAGGTSLRKFATRQIEGPDFMWIYGLVQCTPDLSGQQCWDCLDAGTRQIPGCCNGKTAGNVIYPSCSLRFADSRFYNQTLTAPPLPQPSPSPPLLQQPPSPPPLEGKKHNTTRTVIIVVVSTAVALILLVCACIFLPRMGRKQRKLREKYETTDEISTIESLQYDLHTMRAATDGFSEANKLGQGGFGPVYKGKLPSGQEIAVKRLSKNSRQGELEFKNEVLLMARLQHKNLVRLFGFCLEGEERLLVYEFVPNASLDHFIFDPIKRASLDWDRRYKIIEGIARGLLYLHEDSRLRIIHRDLKAGNILLDVNMVAKVADFGTARLFTVDESQGATSKIVGTYGYMAPEYAMHGQFSVKSDVYSFGVLILEIVSGQKNSNFQVGETIESLLSYAWKNWREGTASNLIDPTLIRTTSCSIQDIIRCIHIGLLCVQENVANRPTMASIVLMLGSSSITLSIPSAPAFHLGSSRRLLNMMNDPEAQLPVKDYNSGNDGVSTTELYPR